MSYAPQKIKDLAAFWVKQGGVNLGIVGNTAHTRGYHLGKDRIYDGSGPGLGSSDYSVQTARDKAGLTNAASALDLGRLDGSLTSLWKFSYWFAKQCMDGKPGYRDVREVIFWMPSRNRVVGWSALAPTQWINDYGDLSHKTHTHISFYRDSENREKVSLFRPYFEASAPAIPEVPMPVVSSYLPGHVATISVADGANVRSAPKLTASLLRTVPGGKSESWTIIGWVTGDASGGSTDWVARWASGRWEYTHKVNVKSVAAPVVTPPPDTTPYSKADLDAAVKVVADERDRVVKERDALLADVNAMFDAAGRLAAR